MSQETPEREDEFVVNSNDAFDRAVAGLRDMDVPQGPSPELLADTLSAIRQAQGGDHLSNKNGIWQRMWTMKAMTRLAAAAVVAIVSGVVIWTAVNWGGQPAFAQVLQKVQQVRSVRFIAETTVTMPDQPKPAKTNVNMLISGDRMRQEVPGQFVSVMDFKKGEVITLMPPQKKAVRMRLENMPKEVRQQNMLEQFRNMQASAGKPIGRKEIDGKMLDEYAVEQGGAKMDVFADPKTQLPVRIEATVEMPAVAKSQVVMKDIEWDVPTNEADLSVDIPAGYDVQETSFNAAKAEEKDLIVSLRTVAGLNDGNLPDTFDMAGMMNAMKKSQAALAKSSDAVRAEFMQSAMTVSRGFMFVQQGAGADFHYAGKGVKLGEAGRAVMWYRPTHSQTYHVVDADLTVHENVKEEDLPKVDSQKVDAAAFFKTAETRVAPAKQPQ